MSPPAETRCPICGKASGKRAFCSRRCADLDLGRWLKGGYAIPGAPIEEANDSMPEDGTPPESE